MNSADRSSSELDPCMEKEGEEEGGIDISRLTRVHLTVTAYYNERARISDHGS